MVIKYNTTNNISIEKKFIQALNVKQLTPNNIQFLQSLGFKVKSAQQWKF